MDAFEMKDILTEKKSERDQLKGQRDTLLKALKELGYASLKQAKEDALSLKRKIRTEQKKIENQEKTIKTKYKDLLT